MEFNCPSCNSLSVVDMSSNKICCNCFFDFDKEFKNKYKEELINESIMRAYNDIPHSLIATKCIYINGKINGYDIKFLFDTGASKSILSNNFIVACELEYLVDTSFKGKLAGAGTCEMIGKVHYIEVDIGGYIFPCNFGVADHNIHVNAILGIDVMRYLGLNINFNKKHISIDNDKIIIPFE
jgi:hypothetical protein